MFPHRKSLIGFSGLFIALLLLAPTSASKLTSKSPVLAADTTPLATVQLSGRITDQLSHPLPGTVVEVIESALQLNVATTATDLNGTYSLSVPAGTYDIKVTPAAGSGFQSVLSANRSIVEDTILDFALVPIINPVTFGLSGKVTDRAGNGVAGLTLFFGAGQVSTDDSGYYQAQVSAGPQHLSIGGGQSPFLPQNIRLLSTP